MTVFSVPLSKRKSLEKFTLLKLFSVSQKEKLIKFPFRVRKVKSFASMLLKINSPRKGRKRYFAILEMEMGGTEYSLLLCGNFKPSDLISHQVIIRIFRFRENFPHQLDFSNGVNLDP